MVVTCDIQFENNPDGTFYAGQVITGKVTLTADKIKQVKAVSLKISGVAKTRWREKHSQNRNRVYWGKVDYIDSLTYLLAPNASDQAVTIEPGIHTFSFACHVPLNCPSSFEGNRGCIRYTAQVRLIRPWKFDQTFTIAFTILTIKNLNYDTPLLKLPVNIDISKTFCCGPFKSDPLQMNVLLPQTGYVPGQLIPVSILVTNDTNAHINEICVRLVMINNFFSTSPTRRCKQETRTVSKLIGDPILRNCKKNFNYLLPIPATPPSCTTLCSIIQTSYRVEVEAKIKGCLYSNQCIHTPVTIGNVPLQMEDMVIQQQPMPKQRSIDDPKDIPSDLNIVRLVESGDSVTNNKIEEPWQELGNIPPPVYKEAIHMPMVKILEDSEHEYGEKNFTPKYPVFNIPSPTCFQSNGCDETGDNVAPPIVTDPGKTTWL